MNERNRVATKIFEGFEKVLFKEFIKGWEPVSTVHYTRPGTCINRPLHQAWIQYQAAHPKLISYTTLCKLACCLPQKQLQNHGSSISPPPKSSKNIRCNSDIYGFYKKNGYCFSFNKFNQVCFLLINPFSICSLSIQSDGIFPNWMLDK